MTKQTANISKATAPRGGRNQAAATAAKISDSLWLGTQSSPRRPSLAPEHAGRVPTLTPQRDPAPTFYLHGWL